MSVRTMSLVFEYDMPELKTDDDKTVPDSTAKFVLLALADHANDEGEGAYPGVKRICKKTSMSTQTVCNALNALRHNGYTTLQEDKSKSGTNNYTINLEVLQPLGFQPLESGDSSGKNRKTPAARVKPSINHPKKPSIKEATPTQPEIKLYREVTKKYPPSPNNEDVVTHIQNVALRLGREVTTEDLRPFYKAWTSCGWNQFSINWLEYAVKGTLPTAKTKANNAPAEPRAFDAIRKYMANQGVSNGD